VFTYTGPAGTNGIIEVLLTAVVLPVADGGGPEVAGGVKPTITDCWLGPITIGNAGGGGGGGGGGGAGAKLTKDALANCVVDIWLVAREGVRVYTVLLTIAEGFGADGIIPDGPLRTMAELGADVALPLNTEGLAMGCMNPESADGTIIAADGAMNDDLGTYNTRDLISNALWWYI